ncbi:Ig-like domain-containing protein, partial [Xanthomonadaceae bacterium JHOS43]|nr:Ig-like domain-containing protein [Xanthomonadaceae bacterium JHOS43]
FTLDGDTVGVAGSDPETWSYFTATTANPNGITLSEQLVVDIAIERGGGIAAGDVVLEFEPWGAPGTWVDIPLAKVGDVLTGTFGPYSLDPVSSEANLRARVARGGTYVTTAWLEGASSGVVFDTAHWSIDVADIDLVGSGNAAGVIGEAVDTGFALLNTGTADVGAHMPAPNDENVRGRFYIQGPVDLIGATLPGCGDENCTSPDVAVEFFNPLTGTYQRIYNLRAELDEFNDPTGRLFGHFGALATGGQPVPAGYTGTFLFRTTFLQHTGTYTVTSQVVGLDSGKVYAEAAPQTVGIGTGTAATIEIVGDAAGEAVVGGNDHDINGDGSLQVRVRDSGGNPVPDAAVAFNVPVAGASANLSAATCTTDGNGLCAVTASSNDVAGSLEVEASIANGQSVIFSLTNLADIDAAQIKVLATGGTPQTAPANSAFGIPLSVLVTDRFDNPLAGQLVGYTANGATANAALTMPALTGADGRSSVSATANSQLGSYTVTAVLGTGAQNTATFDLTNTLATA